MLCPCSFSISTIYKNLKCKWFIEVHKHCWWAYIPGSLYLDGNLCYFIGNLYLEGLYSWGLVFGMLWYQIIARKMSK